MSNNLKSYSEGTRLTIITVNRRDYIGDGTHPNVELEGDVQPQEVRTYVTPDNQPCTVVELVPHFTYISTEGVIFTETKGELIGHRPIGR